MARMGPHAEGGKRGADLAERVEGASEQVRRAFYMAIVSLTTESLQTVAERDIEVPKFDLDEKDTILARTSSQGALFLHTSSYSFCFL